MFDYKRVSACSMAIRDITEHFKPLVKAQFKREGKMFDNYFVTTKDLLTKETTRLNKELGIAGINKIGNTNGKPK